MMFEPRRQHPLAIVFNFGRQLKDLIIPLILFQVSTISIGLETFGLYWIFSAVFIIFGFMMIGSVVSWYRFTYGVEDDELRIEHGLFFRKKRYIRQERIQSIHISAGILHRMFGLAKVTVDTAGGGGQTKLSAIDREEANQLKQSLALNKNATAGVDGKKVSVHEEEPGPTDAVQRKLPFKDLVIAATTSGSFGIVFSLIVAGLTQLDQILTNVNLFSLIARFVENNWTIVLLFIPVIAVLSWLVTVAGTIFQYAYFTLTKESDELRISRGLFEKKELTIPIKRIQAIRVVEGIFRQPFGFTTVYVESAGYGGDDGESTVLFPLLRRKHVEHFLSEMIPSFALSRREGATIQWDRPPKRSLKRYMIRLLVPTLFLVIPVAVYVPWGTFSVLLLPACAWLAWMQFRDTGIDIEDTMLTMRFRRLNRTTVFIPKKRVQSGHITRSWIQRRRELSSVHIRIVSGRMDTQFSVLDMEQKDGIKLLNWVSSVSILSSLK